MKHSSVLLLVVLRTKPSDVFLVVSIYSHHLEYVRVK